MEDLCSIMDTFCLISLHGIEMNLLFHDKTVISAIKLLDSIPALFPF